MLAGAQVAVQAEVGSGPEAGAGAVLGLSSQCRPPQRHHRRVGVGQVRWLWDLGESPR